MREYERQSRNVNGAYGKNENSWRDRDWRGPREESSWRTGQRYGSPYDSSDWSSRPRYGYGESDRGFSGGAMQRPAARSYGAYGQSYGQGGYGEGYYGEGYGGRRRFEPSRWYEDRGPGSAYGRDDPRYSRDFGWDRDRDDQGLWDRFKGEVREGWERLREPDDERYWGRDRDYEQQSFGWNERREPSFWDQTKREAREAWDRVKESFYGKGPKGYARSDERIREDVCDRLAWHPEVDATEIEVTVSGGEVMLAGKVSDRRQKRLAEHIVEDIHGVKDVSNRLRVDRGTFESSTSGDGSRAVSSQTSSTSRAAAR